MSQSSTPPVLIGKKRYSGLWLLLVLPIICTAGLRVVVHISGRFEDSAREGFVALGQFAAIVLGLSSLAAILGWFLGYQKLRVAKIAAETHAVMPMGLSLDSFQQAMDLFGKPVFLPSKHEGVVLAITHDAFELYDGFRVREPRARIKFSDVVSLEIMRANLPIGKEPGVRIICSKGLLDLGFVRNAAFRGLRTPQRVAARQFVLMEEALRLWDQRTKARSQVADDS
ncbi:MAG: hypothetical protein E6Q30_00505 [Aquabacterium sp.]|nr:MAG: hypothetical protein E6Q30_00505 [Aquabacterium sp.]